ncbi:YIP1 family protein [Chryseobacterium antibioticum]|uniref:YIP1 family protein n=1 Tax=Chryseobacterium pyrolae TaxID=2987481 RepID=A0ABT2IDL2_9FLAO|nr:YIP1 family protein [Chryseobacterium pyrolae]MCT2406725.1 YIP1 family protein [Chryseobacterium pyrolae]
MNWKTIFNPFERFDDKLLLVIGILGTALAILMGYWTGTYFSSIYKVNSLEKVTLQAVAIPTLISFASAIIILFILGKILNSKTRLIDIVNTVLISQLLLVILQATEKISFIKEAQDRLISHQRNLPETLPVGDLIVTIGMASFALIILIYSITIYYNGFKTATNIKKWHHIVLFAAVSLIMTLICQILLSKYF